MKQAGRRLRYSMSEQSEQKEKNIFQKQTRKRKRKGEKLLGQAGILLTGSAYTTYGTTYHHSIQTGLIYFMQSRGKVREECLPHDCVEY